MTGTLTCVGVLFLYPFPGFPTCPHREGFSGEFSGDGRERACRKGPGTDTAPTYPHQAVWQAEVWSFPFSSTCPHRHSHKREGAFFHPFQDFSHLSPPGRLFGDIFRAAGGKRVRRAGPGTDPDPTCPHRTPFSGRKTGNPGRGRTEEVNTHRRRLPAAVRRRNKGWKTDLAGVKISATTYGQTGTQP